MTSNPVYHLKSSLLYPLMNYLAYPEVSDEIKCPPCENEEFQCVTSKMCIGQPLICDGKDDCPDGSDEQQNCEGKQSFLTRSFCERGPRNDYIYP